MRFDWDAKSHNWTKRIEETSPTDDKRYVDIEPSYNLFKNTNSQNYFDMSLELSRLNYPDRYTLLLLAIDKFYYNGKICELSDLTPRVQIPPPTFNFSTVPGTLELRPGDEKDVLIKLTSSSYNPATVHFALENHTLGNRIKTRLTADNIAIQPYRLATSNLKIKPLDGTTPGTYTFPINASIDTVTVAATRMSEKTFENMENQSTNQKSYFTMTVLPKLTDPERLDNFVKQWILPMTGIWTLLAGIAAVMVPLMLRVYRKNKNPT